jgi:hypothetical protein
MITVNIETTEEQSAVERHYHQLLDPERLTPARVIRAKCLECVGFEQSEVTRCTARPDKCKLWPFRMGEGAPEYDRGYTPTTRMKAIVRECRLCMGADYAGNGKGASRTAIALVRECESVKCALWKFRTGKNPNQANRKPPARRAADPFQDPPEGC